MSKYTSKLDRQQRDVKTAFLSSYIPRKCGIATFTKDLTKAINDLNPDSLCEIIAIDPGDVDAPYPTEVKFHIDKATRQDYLDAAEYINNSPIEIVCIQHEYGLFGGGDSGPYVLEFMRALKKPMITSLHTILENPSPAHRDVILEIGELSDVIITMLPNGKQRLEEKYGMNPERVVVIHHGVADRPKATKAKKRQFGWQDNKVLLMTGLLSPNKGIDYAIQALPSIVEEFPETIFVIAGQTHPEILRKEGEKYRNQLIDLATSLGVIDNLVLVNEYLTLDTLLEYYEACDIYLTPHLDPQQISSGTLAYALGMGKACISTKYIYAKEMLTSDRGMLVDFKNSDQIAEATCTIFRDPKYLAALEDRAYALGRTMSWPRVAERYLNLFRLILEIDDSLAYRHA